MLLHAARFLNARQQSQERRPVFCRLHGSQRCEAFLSSFVHLHTRIDPRLGLSHRSQGLPSSLGRCACFALLLQRAATPRPNRETRRGYADHPPSPRSPWRPPPWQEENEFVASALAPPEPIEPLTVQQFDRALMGRERLRWIQVGHSC